MSEIFIGVEIAVTLLGYLVGFGKPTGTIYVL